MGDRLEVEGAVFVVDHAVVEAGGLDDPRHPARRELLEPGPQRGPPLAHRPTYAVLFHGSHPARFSPHPEAHRAAMRLEGWDPVLVLPTLRDPPCGRSPGGG